MSAAPTHSTNPTLLADALPEQHVWAARPTASDLDALPGTPAVLCWTAADGAAVQLVTTQQLKRLAQSRLLEPDDEDAAARRARTDLAAVVRGVRWRSVSCPFEGRWWYYRLARELYPKQYRKLVGFGPAWFLELDPAAEIPDWRVSDRVYREDKRYLGPFPTHQQAQTALEGLRDLFELCRYPEQVRKAPRGKRCAYADMGRCDAPCDGSAALEPYRGRVAAAGRFAAGGVGPWIAEAEGRMQAAARELAFERAALIKQQIAFANKWRQQWVGRVGDASAWRMLLVLPVTRRKAWKLYYFAVGGICDGPVAPDRKLVGTVRDWLPGAIAGAASGTTPAAVRMEQAWLVAHLLGHREARDALAVPIGAPEEIGAVAAEVEQWHAERARSKPAKRAGAGTEAGPATAASQSTQLPKPELGPPAADG